MKLDRIIGGLLILGVFSPILYSKIILDADVVETDKLKLNTVVPDSLVIHDSVSIDAFTMNFNNYYLHTTPVLSSQRQYSMVIDGIYKFAAVSNALDAGYYYCYYDCVGGCDMNTPCDSVKKDFRITHMLRPQVDTFLTAHSYYYNFTGADTAMVFEFEDSGGYGDNAGALNISLYDLTQAVHYVRFDSTWIYVSDINSALIMRSEDGGCWKLKVNNSGSLMSTSIACPN